MFVLWVGEEAPPSPLEKEKADFFVRLDKDSLVWTIHHNFFVLFSALIFPNVKEMLISFLEDFPHLVGRCNFSLRGITWCEKAFWKPAGTALSWKNGLSRVGQAENCEAGRKWPLDRTKKGMSSFFSCRKLCEASKCPAASPCTRQNTTLV